MLKKNKQEKYTFKRLIILLIHILSKNVIGVYNVIDITRVHLWFWPSFDYKRNCGSNNALSRMPNVFFLKNSLFDFWGPVFTDGLWQVNCYFNSDFDIYIKKLPFVSVYCRTGKVTVSWPCFVTSVIRSR